jgi:hypothetical protein
MKDLKVIFEKYYFSSFFNTRDDWDFSPVPSPQDFETHI